MKLTATVLPKSQQKQRPLTTSEAISTLGSKNRKRRTMVQTRSQTRKQEQALLKTQHQSTLKTTTDPTMPTPKTSKPTSKTASKILAQFSIKLIKKNILLYRPSVYPSYSFPAIRVGYGKAFDGGYGVGRAIGGDTEAFPAFVDMTPNLPSAIKTSAHCRRHCTHKQCLRTRGRFIGNLRCGGRFVSVECTTPQECEAILRAMEKKNRRPKKRQKRKSSS
jgi:hypothetical protein